MITQATPAQWTNLFPRFVFRGAAVGVGVRLGGPRATTQVAATSCLPVVGGEARVSAKRGSVNGIVSFRAATSETSGAATRKGYETSARTEVLGVNVAGVITARRVAATIRSVRRLNHDPEFVEQVVEIDGLRIAGQPVGLDTAPLKLIRKAPTFAQLQTGFGRGGALRRLVNASVAPGTKRASGGRAPQGQGNTISVALVQAAGGNGAAPLVVDHEGTRFFIFLGEYLVSPLSRRLTMMRVVMQPLARRSARKASGRALAMKKALAASPLDAEAAVAEVEINGHGHP
ncbi:MAG TPA: choice-of-anchor P family protein [Vicinamibacteria bacterium]|nr:choice-of-anchor P family protein [Vicinamibacteria bacterium]